VLRAGRDRRRWKTAASKRAALAVLVSLSIFGPAARAEERLTLRVSPRVAFAPADLVVRATIAADKENRAIEIVADSGDFFRSSEIQLDGDQAPKTMYSEFRSVPSGIYVVRAVLKGSRGQELAAREVHFQVVATGLR